MRLIVHAALLCLGAAPAAAQPGQAQTARQLSEFLGTETEVFNGALVAAGPQQPEIRLARGMADFAAGRPNHPDAVFQLASAAKPFTAVAVLQLRDKRRLSLDDPVKRHLLGTEALRTPVPPVVRQVLAFMFRTTPEDIRTLAYADAVLMRPYRYEGYNLGSTVGDQNLFSTLGDLERFDRALRSGRILSLRSQQEAYRPIRLNNGRDHAEEQVYELYDAKCSYGLGWETCHHPTRGRLVGHAGYVRGIAVMLYRQVDGGRFAAMFDNGDTGEFPKKFASVINILDGLPPLAITRTKSLTRAYGAALVSSGPVPALIRYNQLKANSGEWAGTPAGMNRLGYDLLRNGHPALALEAFRLNVALNPGAANLYDSWAEGLAANGYRQEAIATYRRSLELDPANAAGREALVRLEAEALHQP